MKLAVFIMHVPGEREETLQRLLDELGPPPSNVTLQITEDPDKQGPWWAAWRSWTAGTGREVDWIILLNDDAEPCKHFFDAAEKALAARSKADPVCFYTCHVDASRVDAAAMGRASWYTTHDDFVGVGCALSRDAAEEFLEWAEENDAALGDFSDDGRVNLWAMATGRRIHTTVPSLVDHQLPKETTVGSATDDTAGARRAVVPPRDTWDLEWNTKPVHLGRNRTGNHWEMLFRVKSVTRELIERAYEVERNGEPVSTKPHVFIAMPAYVNPEAAVRASIQNVMVDLERHGIRATLYESPGDSLVTRGRHGLCHEFLKTEATHFLQWDADIECLDPTAVRKMVETKRHVVGGAYPWRDGSGRVVANPLHESMVGGGIIDVDANAKCFKVAEVGTGFMLVSRECLVDLMARHPNEMYMADIEPYVGAPMWALFDARLEYRPQTGRRRYASEDWRFCQLARDAGYDVVVYYPPVFRHWGKYPHQGHIVKAWGMNQKPAQEAAE